MSTSTGVFVGHSSYLDSDVQLGVASGNVISLSFPAGATEETDDHPLLQRFLAYLDEGIEEEFGAVDIALTVPTTSRRIYEVVRTIPRGTDWTAADVAARATIDIDEATVRTALSENPIPFFIPDHRVRDIDGSVRPELRARLRAREGLA